MEVEAEVDNDDKDGVVDNDDVDKEEDKDGVVGNEEEEEHSDDGEFHYQNDELFPSQ